MNITISDLGSPRLNKLWSGLEGGGRERLHEAMGCEVQVLTADYIRGIAQDRHATANRLGGTPTNFLAQAADKVAAPEYLSADSEGATLTINHPGMIRALKDVTIVPGGGKKYLTIPISSAAYGHRAGEFSNLFVRRGAMFPVLYQKNGNSITPMFLLMRKVTQKQDRSLLPSTEEWQKAARTGAITYIKQL